MLKTTATKIDDSSKWTGCATAGKSTYTNIIPTKISAIITIMLALNNTNALTDFFDRKSR